LLNSYVKVRVGRRKTTMSNSPIVFLDYDKISDTLIYFSADITLRFNVQLGRKDKDGHRKFFHRETMYESKYSNVGPVVGIRRDMNFYYSIDDARNYINGVMISIQDVMLLKMLMDNNILPWFIGKKNIYGTNPDDGQLVITGKWKPQQFTLSDYKYLEFLPIVLVYEDGKSNYGIRMIVNDPNNFVDMDLNRFMAFYTIIANTDMYTLASTMLTYAKNEPYGVNMYSMLEEGRNIRYNNGSNNERPQRGGNRSYETKKNFFDSI
jgi:hypothetical protein